MPAGYLILTSTILQLLANGETLEVGRNDTDGIATGTLYKLDNEKIKSATPSSPNSWSETGIEVRNLTRRDFSIYEAPKKIVAFKHTRDGDVQFAEENSPQHKSLQSNRHYEQLKLTQELMIKSAK